MDRSHTVTESSTKEQVSKPSKAAAPSVHVASLPPEPITSEVKQRALRPQACLQTCVASPGVACSELLAVELTQGEWLGFDNWETLNTEMLFSEMPCLPQLFSPGRGNLTENSHSKSKGKSM